MITIGNFNPIPKGSVGVSPDYFYYGEEVIGGVINIELNGTHHASTATEYSGMIETVLGMIDTCQELAGSVECGSEITSLDGTQGVVKDVSVSPGGSALDLNYSINIECSKGSTKEPLIANQSSISFGTIDAKAVANSYEESVSFEDSTSSNFTIDTNGKAWKNHGKYTISLGVGIYDSDRCDSSNINYENGISAFLKERADALAPITSPSYSYYGLSSNKSVGKTEGSASFELIAAPKKAGAGAPLLAMIDYTVTKTTDQKTELSTTIIKGSIQGIGGDSDFLSPTFDSFDNAKSAYAIVSKEVISPEQNLLGIACPEVDEEGGGGGGGGGRWWWRRFHNLHST
jgi:hypothetical protein